VKDGTAADDDNGHDPAAVANSHPSYSNNDDALICILFPKQRSVKKGRGSSNSEIDVSARAPGARSDVSSYLCPMVENNIRLSFL
jgi:hypothetical protein